MPPPRPQTAGATVAADKRAHPTLLTASADAAYWVEQGDEMFTIFRISVGAQVALIEKRQGRANALAADAKNVYVLVDAGNGIDLYRIPLKAAKSDRVAANVGAERVAVDPAGIYLGTGGGSILAIKGGKGKLASLASSPEYSFMSQIASDDKSVYFSNELDDTPKRIYRVGKTGGDVYRVDWAKHLSGWGVAPTGVYYEDDGAIWEAPRQGVKEGEPKVVRLRAGALLAVAGDRLYFVDGGRLGERALGSGTETQTPVTLGDDIADAAAAGGTLWLVRDPDRNSDDPKAEILYWQRK